MKIIRLLLGLSCVLSLSLEASGYKQLVADAEALKNIKVFASQMATQHQFDEQKVFDKLSKMQHRKDIIEKITKPAESMPWFRYRKIWMKDKRIDEGIAFWEKHAETLARAEKVYGVDQGIIVAIIGVETFYGLRQGTYPVIQALHTLGFYYPKRSTFFRKELAEYFQLSQQQGWNIDQIKGSYAGAMGMGQFIASSYRHYAVDFNNDGKVDLFSDPVDIIGSVANYFHKHHWRRDGFVTQSIEPSKKQLSLVQKELKLAKSLEQIATTGINVESLKQSSNSAGIFAFERADGQKEYWLSGDNFYVITRYNHNAMYALAVFQLSEAIKAKRILINDRSNTRISELTKEAK